MANTSDACVPQALTDFVFDLYDSVTLSQLTEEQSRLYNTEFRELSSKVRRKGRNNNIHSLDFFLFFSQLPFFFF